MPIHAMMSRRQDKVDRPSTIPASRSSTLSSGRRVAIQQVHGDPGSLSRQDILSLQRTIGNRAIGELLSGAYRAAAMRLASPPIAQREVETIAGEQTQYCSSFERALIKAGHLSGPEPRRYLTEKEAATRDLKMKEIWEPRSKSGGIEMAKNVVLVKPWIATVKYKGGALEETAADLDLHMVEAQVANIWGKVGVTIQYDASATIDIAMSKLPQEYASDDEFTTELNNAIRPLINQSVLEGQKHAKRGIQAVFIPTNDRWGFTHRPGKGAGFNAPLTIVATKSAGVGKSRTPVEERITSDAPGDFVPLDIILDTAHEIGHAFGLEHAETNKEVHLLMHKNLYHTIGNATKEMVEGEMREKMPEEKAKQLLQARIEKGEGVVGLYKRKGAIVDQPREIWTMMHGPDLTEEQVNTVLNNIKNESYLG